MANRRCAVAHVTGAWILDHASRRNPWKGCSGAGETGGLLLDRPERREAAFGHGQNLLADLLANYWNGTGRGRTRSDRPSRKGLIFHTRNDKKRLEIMDHRGDQDRRHAADLPAN